MKRFLHYLTIAGVAALPSAGYPGNTAEPAPGDAVAVTRRITEGQYRNIIADVFGTDITVGGRFEPDIRDQGLLGIGTSRVSISETGFEQYRDLALTVAAQVTDAQHRGSLIPCTPASPKAWDDACATKFIQGAGRLLYRRPLDQAELATLVGIAQKSATQLNDFYAGVEVSLASMLVSPQFLFRKEAAVADPAHPGRARLDAYSRAARLSFFLWNTAPDNMLLTAAENGSLNTTAGLSKQVDRMIGSGRMSGGVRAFFADMLGFDEFSTLAKDPAIYPKYSFKAAMDVQEQTLRTITDHLLAQRGDYRDLFTTRKTFLTRSLGALYGVAVVDDVANGLPARWVPYEYAEGDPRAGILTHASFVSLHSHPGRSSPTLRGKAFRETFLCQRVPDPPVNVDFTVVQNTDNPIFKTARERLTAHRTSPTCAGCHKITDPIGLALENFDSAGGYRTLENGAPIDTSGELNGKPFADSVGLGRAIRDNPEAPNCLVTRIYSYAAGQTTKNGKDWIAYLQAGFAADGYRVPALMRRIAVSDAFYSVADTPVEETEQ